MVKLKKVSGKHGTAAIAKKVQNRFNVAKKKIVWKYAREIMHLVRKYLIQQGLSFELENGYSYLVPAKQMQQNGTGDFWMQRAGRYTLGNGDLVWHNSGKRYAQGVDWNISDKPKKTTISVRNNSMPKKNRWSMGSTEPIDETSLTKWIVGDGEKSHIHPTPPWGTWFPNEVWKNLWYNAEPYFDEIKESVEYKDILQRLSDELNETYTNILNEEKVIYQKQQIGGRKATATQFKKAVDI